MSCGSAGGGGTMMIRSGNMGMIPRVAIIPSILHIEVSTRDVPRFHAYLFI